MTNTELTEVEAQNLLDRIWPTIKEKFNFPGIKSPEIVGNIDGQDTAAFYWDGNYISVSKGFLSTLKPYADQRNMNMETVTENILDHETGHWVFFPRDLSTNLILLAEGYHWFGDLNNSIYAFYADLANEGALLASGLGDSGFITIRQI